MQNQTREKEKKNKNNSPTKEEKRTRERERETGKKVHEALMCRVTLPSHRSDLYFVSLSLYFH